MSNPKAKPTASSQAGLEKGLEKLLWVMQCLRNPDGGCPWDLQQDFKSIVPYTIEEAYEVADAIERSDMTDFKEELGDLLLQVVFHAQMASERQLFDFDAVAMGIANKMIDRHPHVFGDAVAEKPEDVKDIWEVQKEKETVDNVSVLDDVTLGIPALMRAQKLLKRAARTGFEWPDTQAAYAKLGEELRELSEALEGNDSSHIEEEFGDVFFCLVNYARMHDINAEEALRKANNKFIKRFSGLERDVKANGHQISEVPLAELIAIWKNQK